MTAMLVGATALAATDSAFATKYDKNQAISVLFCKNRNN
jgi:hypothetical protein